MAKLVENGIPEQIKIIIADLLGIEESEITTKSNLRDDLQADSLDAVECVMLLEDHFKIQISDEEAEEASTFEAIVAIVTEKVSYVQ